MNKSEQKADIHLKFCETLHQLYLKKNSDYGDSYAQLRKRYPNYICARLFDKLNRLDTMLDPNHMQQMSDESFEDTLLDIANYAILEVVERRAELITTVSPQDLLAKDVFGSEIISDKLPPAAL